MTTPADLAASFTALHHADRPLLLANAWDVASAVVTEAAGAPAVATTSAGVAWSLGRPDGDQLGRELAVDLVRRVCAAVRVPVTADIESGFGEQPADVAETVLAVIEAGAVGINLEDSVSDPASPLRSVDDAAERIAAARSAAESAGVPIYLNARTDTYLRQVGEPGGRLDDTITRARAYLDAGASGIFVPGTVDPAIVASLTEAIDAPVNLLVGPGAPDVATLAAAGARRLSLGSSVAAAAYAVADAATRELLSTGTYASVAAELDYGLLNGLVAG